MPEDTYARHGQQICTALWYVRLDSISFSLHRQLMDSKSEPTKATKSYQVYQVPASSVRHGDRSGQRRISFVAQAVVLSLWHDVHGLGILYLSVMSG